MARERDGDRVRQIEDHVVGRPGQPDDDVVLGGREGVAVGTRERVLNPVTPGGAASGAIAAHSSGRKPATRLTPPIVVLGSRSPATRATVEAASAVGSTSNSR